MTHDPDPTPPIAVRLRPVRSEDLPWIADMTSDPVAVGEHNWGGEQRDRASEEGRLRAEFERHGMHTESDGTLVVERDDGIRIGTVSWRTERWGPSLGSRCPAFGIALLPQFRGRGLGTDAQRQLIDYLFETTDAHRIQSDTATSWSILPRSCSRLTVLLIALLPLIEGELLVDELQLPPELSAS